MNKIFAMGAFLLLATAASAQTFNENGEVVREDVYLNGLMSQNCMIYRTSLGAAVPCSNCSASVEIRDAESNEVTMPRLNGAMKRDGDGIFIFNLEGSGMEIGRTYSAVVSCLDADTGNIGDVKSTLTVVQPSSFQSAQDKLSSLWEGLTGTVKAGYLGLVERTTEKLDRLTGIQTIGVVGDIFVGILKGSLWLIKALWGIATFFARQLHMLMTEPSYYIWEVLWPTALTALTSLIAGSAIAAMFAECFIMSIAILRSSQEPGFTARAFGFFNELIMIHYRIGNAILNILGIAVNIAGQMVNGITQIIIAATTWIP